MTIGIIVGSVRRGAVGTKVTEWVKAATEGRDAEYKVLNLADFRLPFMEEEVVPAAANRQYADVATREWSAAVDDCDGFIFITPEYNHSVPGPMKNAVDLLMPEWLGKPVAFVGYSYTGGVRAVEAWRLVVANFSMPALREQIAINMVTDLESDGSVKEGTYLDGALADMLTKLEAAVA